MSEEEKEAIENLRKDLKENIQEDNKIDNYKYISNLYSNGDIDIVLNLIEKLQKENESDSKLIANMSKRHFEDSKKIDKLQDRINKAIEFIKYRNGEVSLKYIREDITKILKGEDNEL